MAAYIEEHASGITWVIDEPMARASHALVDDGRVWIIDPVDDKEAMEKVVALGKPVAVFQLLDRHNRDCEAIAKRLDVPHVTQPDEHHPEPLLVREGPLVAEETRAGGARSGRNLEALQAD